MSDSISQAVLACLPRSPEQLEADLDALNPAGDPSLIKHDVDGDGKNETFCNILVQRFCARRGLVIFKARANDMIKWLDSGLGREQGWLECSEDFAKRAAGRGENVIIAWFNPAGHPGHMSVMRDKDGNHAQAGGTNTNKAPWRTGYILSTHKDVRFFHQK